MNLITIGVIDLYLNLITSYISLNTRLFRVLKAVKLCWYFKSFLTILCSSLANLVGSLAIDDLLTLLSSLSCFILSK